MVLVRKARGAEPPPTLKTDPLVYQGGSGTFLAPTEDICHYSEEYGIDFEAEICVITGDTPMYNVFFAKFSYCAGAPKRQVRKSSFA